MPSPRRPAGTPLTEKPTGSNGGTGAGKNKRPAGSGNSAKRDGNGALPAAAAARTSAASTASGVDSMSAKAAVTAEPVELNQREQRLLADLFAIVEEHASQAAVTIDRARVREAFVYAC